jgi:hypothetical protein
MLPKKKVQSSLDRRILRVPWIGFETWVFPR